MNGFLGDVRFAFRALLANPAFVVLSVLCLGLGIGASTMVFTVVDGTLVRPLGPVDPDGLVGIAEIRQATPDEWWSVSLANYRVWQTAAARSAQMSALRASSFAVGSDASGARVEGVYATDDLFAVLGVAPIFGRGLQAADDDAGSEPVIVLSESFWRQRFAGGRAVLGSTLPVDGISHTVVGVVPDLHALGMPGIVRSARVWVPLATDARRTARDDRNLLVIARLAPGVGLDAFGARLEAAANESATLYPENTGWSVRVATLNFGGWSNARAMLLLSLGAAWLLLLIACANITNLTLAHAVRRRHEFAIRAALGASRWRIARQLLTESLLVAMLGTMLGLVIARLGLTLFVRLYAADSLAPASLPIDTRSLAFTLGLAVLTTALVGLYPAVEATRGATRAQIAESGSGTTTARVGDGLRNGLVVGQMAASLMLLIGAALLARSLMNLLALDGGVETASVTSIRIDPLEERVPQEDVARLVERMIDALSAIPGVTGVASSNVLLPLRGGGYRSRVSVSDSATESSAEHVIAYAGVTPEFFAVLGIPLLRGEVFGQIEQFGRSAVVNESLARLLWPNQDPVGSQFLLDSETERGWITVTGVSGDFLTWDSSADEPLPAAYLDAKSFDALPIFFFIRRATADQVIGAGAITRAVQSFDFPVRRVVVTPMETVAREPFWRQQMFSLWFTVFGIAALTLTAVGVYGVLAYLVWQRWREIGIRMALGADRHHVLCMISARTGRLLAIGMLIGLAGAYALARGMNALLYGVESFDPSVFISVSALLSTVVMAASVVPAVRAARTNANILLKT